MQDHTEKGDDVVIFNHKYAPYFEQWAVQKSYPVVVDDGTVSDETRVDAVCDIKFAITQRKLDDDLLVIAGDNMLDFGGHCLRLPADCGAPSRDELQVAAGAERAQ